jgi:hypothetical protein
LCDEAIDRILGEIVHSKFMTTPIENVLFIGHFLTKNFMMMIEVENWSDTKFKILGTTAKEVTRQSSTTPI